MQLPPQAKLLPALSALHQRQLHSSEQLFFSAAHAKETRQHPDAFWSHPSQLSCLLLENSLFKKMNGRISLNVLFFFCVVSKYTEDTGVPKIRVEDGLYNLFSKILVSLLLHVCCNTVHLRCMDHVSKGTDQDRMVAVAVRMWGGEGGGGLWLQCEVNQHSVHVSRHNRKSAEDDTGAKNYS